MTKHNFILLGDAYKYSHPWQLPKGTTKMSSYIEARGFSDLFETRPDVLFSGLDAFIRDYLEVPITEMDIIEAEIIVKGMGLPFHKEGWTRILKMHGGYIPVRIDALKEGTVVHPSIPLVQVVNLDEELPWITSFIETALLRAIWYPTTVGTLSREIKKVIKRYLEETGDPALLPFKLHDFGARGVSSHESAELGGLAHLINFMGTDTTEAVRKGYHMYGEILGFSIPASEHSTITSWLRRGEVDAFRNMLTQWPTGLVACVSDSYDLYGACRDLWGDKLKAEVLSRDGTLVVRPDSGDPVEVTLEVIEILGEQFGYTVNEKGYKVLDPHVRMIQGDGISLETIIDILENFKLYGWSADNIAFGMGGALLQRLDRDTLKFAMKANEATVDGIPRAVYKDPVTDHGKHSKRWRQAVYRDPIDGNIKVMEETAFDAMVDDIVKGIQTLNEGNDIPRNMLKTRWFANNGHHYVWERSKFADIRERAEV